MATKNDLDPTFRNDSGNSGSNLQTSTGVPRDTGFEFSFSDGDSRDTANTETSFAGVSAGAREPETGTTDSAADRATNTDVFTNAPKSKLDIWQRNLLDLSPRSPLISTRISMSAIQILHPRLWELEDTLSKGSRLLIVQNPVPELASDLGNEEQIRANSVLLDDMLKKGLLPAAETQTLLCKKLSAIFRRAQKDLSETGVNTLYLSIGHISWSEASYRGSCYTAPVLLYPVNLIRKNKNEYLLTLRDDDEAQLNFSIFEKFRTSIGYQSSLNFENLPRDDNGLDTRRIFEIIRNDVKSQPGWSLTETAALGLFSFDQFVMWNDIRRKADQLSNNKIVESLIKGRITFPQKPLPEVSDDDFVNELVPVSCDESQMQAVKAAAAGRSFILQGPPGTGKSQTITAMVLDAMTRGKKILFVAEKMAALQVVYRNLKKVGLSDYLLELHSTRATKSHLIEQLEGALNRFAEAREPDSVAAERISRINSELSGYVRALHEKTPSGLSVYELINRWETLRDVPEETLTEMNAAEIASITEADLEDTYHHLVDYSRLLSKFQPVEASPYRFLSLTEFDAAKQDETRNALRNASALVRDILLDAGLISGIYAATKRSSAASDETNITAGGDATVSHSREDFRIPEDISLRELESLLRIVRDLNDPNCDTALSELENSDAESARSLLRSVENYQRKRADLEKAVSGVWNAKALDLDVPSLLQEWSGIKTGLFKGGKRRDFASKINSYSLTGGIDEKNVETSLRTLTSAINLRMEMLAAERTLPDSGRKYLNSDIKALSSALESVLAARERLESLEFGFERRATARAAQTGSQYRLQRGSEGTKTERRVSGLPDPSQSRVLPDSLSSPEAPENISVNLDAALRAVLTFSAKNPDFSASCEALFALLPGISNTLKIKNLEDSSLSDLCERFDLWFDNMAAVHDWASCNKALEWFSSHRFAQPFAERLRCRENIKSVYKELKASYYKTQTIAAVRRSPLLSRYTHDTFEDLVSELTSLEKTYRENVVRVVPGIMNDIISSKTQDEMARRDISRFIASGGRRRSIRSLFSTCSEYITNLFPCFLMSPMSAAQFLEPGQQLFDIVVFDEASQIQTCKAVGAISRGKNLIVVGDSKQMPPTSFFKKTNFDDETEEWTQPGSLEDLSSILDDCNALGLESCHLEWHYRSADESLIYFSNKRYYNGRLKTYPSVNAGSSRVVLKRLSGGFYKQGERINEFEAEAIVSAIKARLSNPATSGDSIGVITFNIKQQELILDRLDEMFERNRNLSRLAHWDENEIDCEKKLIVKNLENIQGDERDVIMLSVTFGPNQTGSFSKNFGAIAHEGGGKRLNVAFSRAKKLMEVYTIINPAEVSPEMMGSAGGRDLIEFLRFAAGFTKPDVTEDSDEAVRRSLAAALEDAGFRVSTGLGLSEFKIDIAVKNPVDPSGFLCGILLDGRAVTGAKLSNDRFVLRRDVLRGRGWAVITMRTIDWKENSTGETARILKTVRTLEERAREAAEKARQDAEIEAPDKSSLSTAKILSDSMQQTLSPKDFPPAGALSTGAAPEDTEPGDRSTGSTIAEVQTSYAGEYRAAELDYTPMDSAGILRLPKEALEAKFRLVIEAEGPVLDDLLELRVLGSFGLKKRGKAVKALFDEILGSLDMPKTEQVNTAGEKHLVFWPSKWAVYGSAGSDVQKIIERKYIQYRSGAANEESKRSIQLIPQIEIKNAMTSLVRDRGGYYRDTLLEDTSKRLGFKRSGTDIKATLALVYDAALRSGSLCPDKKTGILTTPEI